MKMFITPNQDKTGFAIPSEYNKSLLKEWLKKFRGFDLIPREKETKSSRGYLEGAVIPAYCEWQYGINSRDQYKDEARRFLFKKDFNYEIYEDRKGNPVRSPASSKGKVKEILGVYTRYAEENGSPIPNAELYKLWKNKWSLDFRFPTYFEFLDFLGLECDAMPSDSILNKLKTEEKEIDYPENNLGKTAF